MSVVLPGDHVPAQHVNLKLGPGLLQVSNVVDNNTESNVMVTRAGILNHSTNRSKWWVESNSRRVSLICLHHAAHAQIKFIFSVCPGTPRVGDRRCNSKSWRGIPS
jgi:hypothetical protein